MGDGRRVVREQLQARVGPGAHFCLGMPSHNNSQYLPLRALGPGALRAVRCYPPSGRAQGPSRPATTRLTGMIIRTRQRRSQGIYEVPFNSVPTTSLVLTDPLTVGSQYSLR